MVNPSDHVETPTWDSPPHLMGNSIFGIPRLELSEKLSAVSKPVYEDDSHKMFTLCLPFATLIKWQLRLK